ncbi:acyl-homoserine-lactone synthase [Yoonia sp. SDW83-1]|uniref:acyl-homoserine-lactone synthase n=1 Tax=Yoonia sp. SDW83-1 TaxID=3366945 RepID=UPI00398C2CE3
MIRLISGHNLFLEPDLARSMFRHRAAQFYHRLGWTVQIDNLGMERDVYDRMNPLYVLVVGDDGQHLGSMRFLPTIGRTMLNEHFGALHDGPKIKDPRIWECTRFCLAPGADSRTSFKLLAAGASLMKEFNLSHLIAVFDHQMKRLYRNSQVSPTIVASGDYKGESVSIGMWDYSPEKHVKLLKAAGMDHTEMELYLANSDIFRDIPQTA